MAKAKKAALPKAPRVEVGEFLLPLAHEINVRLDKAEQITGKAYDHRLAAALKLEQARKECEARKVNFKKWCETNVTHSYESVRKLARVGGSENPPKALADLRAGVKRAMKKSRAKKAKIAADPVAVAETAIATMKEPEAVKFIEKQAKKLNVAPKAAGTGDKLADAKFAFDALSAAEKIKLLAYAAEKTGAQVTLFGKDVKEAAEPADAAVAPRRRRRVA